MGGEILYRIRHTKSGRFAAIMGTTVLGLTATFTLGGFSAGIANSTSTFSTATVQLREGNGTTTCYSTGSGSGGTISGSNTNSSCAIDALGGGLDQVPGGTPVSTNITLTNVGGGTPQAADLVTGACSAGNASDNNGYEGANTSGFCGDVWVTVANTTSGATDKCVYPTQSAVCPALSSSSTLSGLASTTFNATPLSIPAPGTPSTYTVTVELDPAAANSDQGLTATIPFTWSISQ